MMQDAFGRRITYLRVSITDRCNLRCLYCVPEERIRWVPREERLRFEEVRDFVCEAAAMGITKVRITGGEPLIRRDIVRFVEMLSAVPGIAERVMTTNGIFLAPLAKALKGAGLGRVNISMDSLDPARYARITGGGDLNAVLAGIAAAQEADLNPVKINFVILPGVNEDEIGPMAGFCRERGLIIQLIEAMDLRGARNPALRFHMATRPGPCEECNKLRLTCDGRLMPCLFSDLCVNIRDYRGRYREALAASVALKPERGGEFCHVGMNRIGG
jgi:cyclic pyranopterin phosphate synthase